MCRLYATYTHTHTHIYVYISYHITSAPTLTKSATLKMEAVPSSDYVCFRWEPKTHAVQFLAILLTDFTRLRYQYF